MTTQATAADLPPLPEPLEIIWPTLHKQALGCGVEDRGIRDRYEAAEYGWQDGVDKAVECVPDGVYDADQVRAYASAYALASLAASQQEIARLRITLARIEARCPADSANYTIASIGDTARSAITQGAQS